MLINGVFSYSIYAVRLTLVYAYAELSTVYLEYEERNLTVPEIFKYRW